MNVTSIIQYMDQTLMPWSYNSANNPDTEVVWTQYSHFTCYTIETFYQRYKNGDQSYRQIPIQGDYVIDF